MFFLVRFQHFSWFHEFFLILYHMLLFFFVVVSVLFVFLQIFAFSLCVFGKDALCHVVFCCFDFTKLCPVESPMFCVHEEVQIWLLSCSHISLYFCLISPLYLWFSLVVHLWWCMEDQVCHTAILYQYFALWMTVLSSWGNVYDGEGMSPWLPCSRCNSHCVKFICASEVCI